MTLLAAAVASIAGGLYLVYRSVRPAKVKQMRANAYMDEHLGI